MALEHLTGDTAFAAQEAFVKTLPPYAGHFHGRGVVICGGGSRYFTNAWVCINMLRKHGCSLPVQLWYLGSGEMNGHMERLVRPLGVQCVNGLNVRKLRPARILNGWELKPYAILNSPFREVLYLDADNVAVVNPEFLFETGQYAETGAIFWPDYGRLGYDRSIWDLCGVEYRDEPEIESGQIVVDKERCWDPLMLAMWYNEHSDFYYHHIHGDKETFHMAFRRLEQPYAMPERGIHSLPCTMCQHDFVGNRIFQHRNLDKWSLFSANYRIPGFEHEEQCLAYLEELRAKWNGTVVFDERPTLTELQRAAIQVLTGSALDYQRMGYDRREMTFLRNGLVGNGAAACEVLWRVIEEAGKLILEIASETSITCRLTQHSDNVWMGQWLIGERMPIELSPISKQTVADARSVAHEDGPLRKARRPTGPPSRKTSATAAGAGG
jgi:hypothetical protein